MVGTHGLQVLGGIVCSTVGIQILPLDYNCRIPDVYRTDNPRSMTIPRIDQDSRTLNEARSSSVGPRDPQAGDDRYEHRSMMVRSPMNKRIERNHQPDR